jgi:hypothetical protein
MRLLSLFAVAFGFVGCDERQPKPPVTLHEQRQEVLDRIADTCGLARSTFKLNGDDDLHIQPDPDAKYERVDCALTELKKANMPVKGGFIRNEYVAENRQ